MPTAPQILAALVELAQKGWALAAFWHIYIAVFAASLALMWKPAKPIATFILALPLASVVVMAWLAGNPFTTLVLGAVLIGTLAIGSRLPGMVSLIG